MTNTMNLNNKCNSGYCLGRETMDPCLHFLYLLCLSPRNFLGLQLYLYRFVFLLLTETRPVSVRMVTNSSAAEGCIPTVLSNCAFVAPHFNATAMPCIISGASGPHMEAPITLSVSASTRSFIIVFSCRPETVFFIGLKVEVKTNISPFACCIACSSLRPTTERGGMLNTADGTLS
uniref:Glutathione reductase n=1 Tax=Rhizophora mucronata TaxID=61149 RepID=A0A2P2JTT9_RHIMU